MATKLLSGRPNMMFDALRRLPEGLASLDQTALVLRFVMVKTVCYHISTGVGGQKNTFNVVQCRSLNSK